MAIEETHLRPRKGLFYGWWVVAGGFLVQMLQGTLFFHSFGAYFVYLQNDFGWSRTMLSGAFSLQRLESGMLGPLEGWLIDRFGPRAMVRIGVVVAGVGLILFSQVHSLWQFYAAFAIIALGASLGGFLAISTAVTNWFTRRRSRAMGVSMSGSNVGGLLVPVIAWFLASYGWRPTVFASGLVIIVIGVFAAQFLRRSPEEHGYLPDGIAPSSGRSRVSSLRTHNDALVEAAEVDVSFTVREAMKTRAFWFVAFGHAGALVVVSAMTVHLIPHIVERLEFSVQIAGTMVSLMTGMTIFSQILVAPLGDRMEKRLILVLCLLGHAAALFGLAFSSTIWQVALSVALHGLSWGTRGPLVMAIRADYFGRGSYATIMGFSSLVMMLGMMAGPLFAGVLADRLGDYKIAFLVLASVAALSSVFFVLARKPELPSRLRRRLPQDS